MDEGGTATLSIEGDGQVVHLPKDSRLQGRELRVTRVGDGLLLRPALSDVDESRAKLAALEVDAWRAKLDEYSGIPFTEDGRQQPPMPDVSDISSDR